MSLKKVKLGDVLSYEQPTKYIVKSDSYNDANEIPVLTAGKSFILGYTNEVNNVFQDLPVIIFDDFTTAIKYVDFPFKVKSSAMKILKADEKISDVRYLFHKMSTLKIDKDLHKRYWISKYSQIQIPLPPLPIQKQIAEILDKVDALRKKDLEMLKHYDALAQSLFIDMFGDPVRNEKGWEVKLLGDVCEKITDGEHINPQIVEIGKPLLMAKDILSDGINFDNYKCVSESDFLKFTKKCKPEKGNLIIVSRGATIGRCCVVDTDRPFCLMGSTILVKPSEQISSSFLNLLFKNTEVVKTLTNVSSASAQQAIYIANLKKFKILTPPTMLQNQFAEQIKNIELQKEKVKEQIKASENLFQALLQKMFS